MVMFLFPSCPRGVDTKLEVLACGLERNKRSEAAMWGAGRGREDSVYPPARLGWTRRHELSLHQEYTWSPMDLLSKYFVKYEST